MPAKRLPAADYGTRGSSTGTVASTSPCPGRSAGSGRCTEQLQALTYTED